MRALLCTWIARKTSLRVSHLVISVLLPYVMYIRRVNPVCRTPRRVAVLGNRRPSTFPLNSSVGRDSIIIMSPKTPLGELHLGVHYRWILHRYSQHAVDWTPHLAKLTLTSKPCRMALRLSFCEEY